MPRPSRLKKTLLIGLPVLAAGTLLYFYFRKAPPPPPPHYTISKVAKGDVAKIVMATGQLTPFVSVEVSTQISGLITEVKVDFNSPVKKGEVLALIDPSTYEQAINQARANLHSAEAANDLNRLMADRQRQLLEKHLAAQQDYDQALALSQQSQALLLTQQAIVKSAQVDLDRCTITSPIDGVVIYKAADVGKTVQASFTAPTLFVIAQDLRKMRIIAPVSEVDVWSVKPGQEVTFTVDALPNRTFHGILRQIRNPYTPSDKQNDQNQSQANASITTFDAVIEVENPDLVLLPSLTANVSIVVEKHKDVLNLPNSALRVQVPPPGGASPPGPEGGPVAASSAAAPEEGDGMGTVYRLPGGDRNATPEKIAIHVGLTDSIITEVVSGLKEGDTVITGITPPPYVYRSGLFF